MSLSNSEQVRVDLGERSYDIPIRTDAISDVGSEVSQWWDQCFGAQEVSRKAFVVTDENVAPLHTNAVVQSLEASGWNVALSVVPAGEESKCVGRVEELYDALVEMPADRQTVVVAVGGGVVGDLAGFAAATFNRGIPFVQVPTTLLAQVDSSVGGKTGVNHAQGKNLIGAFHQPLGVFVDTHTLTTLEDRDYRAGLAEVVKYGVIMDEPFFGWLEENTGAINQRDPAALRHIVKRCCELKAEVVAEDERETSGRRAILNYGHTFAHAFEALSDYSQLLHGEAVSIGMIYAGVLAKQLGRVDSVFCDRQTALLSALHLPVTLPSECQFETNDILHRMARDKKTVGNELRFILPTQMGNVEVVKGVGPQQVEAALNL
ncbi:MAG: 3-dehydroquinate synthase [Planctomycetaceae bacterium]